MRCKLVLFANSYKYNNRCVVGKVLESDEIEKGKWIRPIFEKTEKNAVPVLRCAHLLPLDVVVMQLKGNANNPNHPEDWFVDESAAWQKTGRCKPVEITEFADKPHFLWKALPSKGGPSCDFVSRGYVAHMNNPASVYLIKSDEYSVLLWKKDGKPKTTFLLTHNGQLHRFAVTDPRLLDHCWKGRQLEADNIVSLDKDALKGMQIEYVCLSLTPEFNGGCYKILAGAIRKDS